MHNQWLADAILVLHVLIVLFNVGSLPVIWIGYFRGWRFVRNLSFRITHLVLIGFVAAESVVGAICPLTIWEDALRSAPDEASRYDGGFIAYWLQKVLYYDFDPWVFTAAYVAFFFLVLFTFYWVKPGKPTRSA